MELPKIKNEDLPEELKSILGDNDAEFEAIVDPSDIIDIQFDPDAFYESRSQIAEKLIESRKKAQELARQQRLSQDGGNQ